MSRTLTISDTLYERLAAEARAEGVSSVERYLEERLSDDVLSRRARRARRRCHSGKSGGPLHRSLRQRRNDSGRPEPLMNPIVINSSVAIKWYVTTPMKNNCP